MMAQLEKLYSLNGTAAVVTGGRRLRRLQRGVRRANGKRRERLSPPSGLPDPTAS